MSRRAYLPIAVELHSWKGVIFEVLPAGTFNRVTVYQRTRGEGDREAKQGEGRALPALSSGAGRCTETEGPNPSPAPPEASGPPRARRVRSVVDGRDTRVHAVKVGSLYSGVGGFDLGLERA